MSDAGQHELVTETWRRICFHLDGLAIGTSVEALHELGGFAVLMDAGEPLAVPDLAERLSAQPGYLNLVFRLLELQGHIARSGDVAGARPLLALTKTGREWMRDVPAYRGFCERIRAAQALLGQSEFVSPEDTIELPDRIACHLEGPVAAAAMTALSRSELFTQDTEAVECRALPHPAIADIVVRLGWASVEDARFALNDAGRLALHFSAQYYYPVSYLPTLAAVPEMLRGIGTGTANRGEDGTEGHVDRELDIAFSGLVFARTCRAPLFDLVLPLFDTEQFDAQPKAIVDCGGGDGTLLCELYAAIAEQTRRGAALSRHPLAMIGVEYNPVAERVLADRLNRAAVPGLVFAGDIGNPAAIATRLAAEGFTPDDVLHVSKSVFHNRTYAGTPGSRAGTSHGAFVAPGGALLAADRIEADLEALLASWRKVIGRHGMVVIEAHIIESSLVTARLGRSVMTSLEASHGYSHQYLLEIEQHRSAARRAGLRLVGSHDFGAPFMGAPIMSIDHYAV